jgi:hypothetical protein
MSPQMKIASPNPPHCASCYQAKSPERHVDFGAAYDGPVMAGDPDVEGQVTVAIDDLIVCETCLKEAAELVGLGDVEELKAQIDNMVEQGIASADRIVQLEEYVERLEGTLSSREKAQPKQYPYTDGDTVVLGPECFVSKDGSVLSWQGVNYAPADAPVPA